MEFGITADINFESGVREVLGVIPIREYKDYFYVKNYGFDLIGVYIVLMCRDSEYNFKQRIRFIKKEKCLYMDIMLDNDLFVKISHKERTKIVLDKLITEVPEIIAKYKFKDFDLAKFTEDWTGLISKIEK